MRQRLGQRYAHPIVLENDVNLAALGELWFGAEPQGQDLVLIAIGTGIGAGVVINGMVYSGAHHMAGEVGYLTPDRECLNHQYPGFGALEQLASGTGIAVRARQALQGQRDPAELDDLTSEDVFEAARRMEPWARRVLQDTVDYLAQAIGAIALIFVSSDWILAHNLEQYPDSHDQVEHARGDGFERHIRPLGAHKLERDGIASRRRESSEAWLSNLVDNRAHHPYCSYEYQFHD